jgi:hypothetical protein
VNSCAKEVFPFEESKAVAAVWIVESEVVVILNEESAEMGELFEALLGALVGELVERF